MDRLPTSIFALLCLCLFALSPARADAIEDQVKAAYADWDAAFNDADAKAIAAFYTDDAIFLPAIHDVIRGPEGVEAFFCRSVRYGRYGPRA